ncbi:YcjF family protein [Proteiniclasticum sp. C24MP]|uniref:YcjF family protein n=1 Tax=Proteiniclasticum sp. C24MP TaxID=3374101 RepID=UPI0037548B4B
MDVINVVKDIVQLTEEEVKKMNPINIMLAGKTGVGKSTLINHIFRENLAATGTGKPVTKHLEKITKEGVPITLYDTKGLELNPSVQAQVRKEVFDEIRRLNQYGEEKDKIHVVWYCLNAGSSRLESFEEGFIRELSEVLPVVVVLTQSIQDENTRELSEYIRSLRLNLKGLVSVIAKPYVISGHHIPSFGLEELVNVTFTLLPESAEQAFINAQKVDVMKKAAYAKKWAKGFITETFMVGFTPVPFADAPILASSQIAMIAKITSIFGISVNKGMITSIVSSAAGVSGAVFTGRTLVSNLLKLVPGAGTLVGGIISGSTAALITTALAYAYINVMIKVATSEYQNKQLENSEVMEMMKKELRHQMDVVKKEKKES